MVIELSFILTLSPAANPWFAEVIVTIPVVVLKVALVAVCSVAAVNPWFSISKVNAPVDAVYVAPVGVNAFSTFAPTWTLKLLVSTSNTFNQFTAAGSDPLGYACVVA